MSLVFSFILVIWTTENSNAYLKPCRDRKTSSQFNQTIHIAYAQYIVHIMSNWNGICCRFSISMLQTLRKKSLKENRFQIDSFNVTRHFSLNYVFIDERRPKSKIQCIVKIKNFNWSSSHEDLGAEKRKKHFTMVQFRAGEIWIKCSSRYKQQHQVSNSNMKTLPFRKLVRTHWLMSIECRCCALVHIPYVILIHQTYTLHITIRMNIEQWTY